MTLPQKTACPFSLKDLDKENPYVQYDAMRAHGDIVWDEKLKSWLVLSASGCRELMRDDLKKIRFWMADLGQVGENIQGKRSLKLLTGEEHRRVHTWWLKQF